MTAISVIKEVGHQKYIYIRCIYAYTQLHRIDIMTGTSMRIIIPREPRLYPETSCLFFFFFLFISPSLCFRERNNFKMGYAITKRVRLAYQVALARSFAYTHTHTHALYLLFFILKKKKEKPTITNSIHSYLYLRYIPTSLPSSSYHLYFTEANYFCKPVSPHSLLSSPLNTCYIHAYSIHI